MRNPIVSSLYELSPGNPVMVLKFSGKGMEDWNGAGVVQGSFLYLCGMARRCEVTGRRPQVGYNVSHSNRHTKRRFDINLQSKRLPLLPQAGKEGLVRIKLTTRALKTLYRKGYLP